MSAQVKFKIGQWVTCNGSPPIRIEHIGVDPHEIANGDWRFCEKRLFGKQEDGVMWSILPSQSIVKRVRSPRTSRRPKIRTTIGALMR
jgi:hypothetical protein